MIGTACIKPGIRALIGAAVVMLCGAGGCTQTASPPGTFQGYAEGEFVYVAAALPGRMAQLFVQRGMQVKAGDPLFELEDVPERAAHDETRLRLEQQRAQLADASKGKRPGEIEAAAAQLNLARSALQLSEKELVRLERLLTAQVVSQQEVDRLRSQRDQERQRVAGLAAELGTAKLGARRDQIAAARASMQAMQATLTRSRWDLAQKRQSAPQAGLVFDTLYRSGEWVAAGRPAVVLLPPQNIKVRLFVPQSQLAAIHQGDRAEVTVDGGRTPFSGTVRFISPQAEYTPPVIYSRESRQKLVYLIELSFEPATAGQLHPGQPVTVRLGAAS